MMYLIRVSVQDHFLTRIYFICKALGLIESSDSESMSNVFVECISTIDLPNLGGLTPTATSTYLVRAQESYQ